MNDNNKYPRSQSSLLRCGLNLTTALPLLLIGIAVSGGCIIAGGACYEIPLWRLYAGITFGGIIAVFIGVVGVLGLIKKLPDWSIIWIAISMVGFLVVVNFISSLGLSFVAELLVLIFSILIGLFVFFLVAEKSWESAGLFGIGLSSALSLVLFFIATNVSHDKIQIGYFDALWGLLMSGLVWLYLKSNHRQKILVLITFAILNSVMIWIFDSAMQKIGQESQLVYLLLFSNGLLVSGVVFHFFIGMGKRLVKHFKS